MSTGSGLFLFLSSGFAQIFGQIVFRDGPLENLWGAVEVQKKYSSKAKLNEKKFMHAN